MVLPGPASLAQHASSAFQFALSLIVDGHELSSVFFYREGVYNANQLT
ncbi:DsrE family protein, partial [Escherichia coli]